MRLESWPNHTIAGDSGKPIDTSRAYYGGAAEKVVSDDFAAPEQTTEMKNEADS